MTQLGDELGVPMSDLRSVVDDLSKGLQGEFQFSIAEEKYPYGPAIFLCNSSVKIGIWLDERITLIQADIGLADQWGNGPGSQYSMHMIIRFRGGDLSELKDNRPGIEISEQVRVCIEALRKYGRAFLAGDKDAFQQLSLFAHGYRCRYTEEMSEPRPAKGPKAKARGVSLKTATLLFLFGAAITAVMMTYWASYLCSIDH